MAFLFFRCAGCLAVYALGFLLRWDTIAIYSPVLPAAAFVIGFFVPESPVFLMHKVTLNNCTPIVGHLLD